MGRGLGSGPTYWTLQNSQGEAKTALSHLLQSLGPPSHDRDALLTIQFRLVSGPWGPGAHHERRGKGGWGKDTVILLLSMAIIGATKTNGTFCVPGTHRVFCMN